MNARRKAFSSTRPMSTIRFPAAVGLKVLEIVERDGLAARAASLGARLKKGLIELQSRHPCIGDVRGRGSLLGLEFIDERGGKKRSWPCSPMP